MALSFSFTRKSRTSDASEPTKLLVADHEKAERLFDEIESADSMVQRQSLVAQLAAELYRHMQMEERVLYPFVRDEVPGGADLAREAEQEHEQAKQVLAGVASLDPASPDFPGELKQLKKLVQHHVKEEEKDLLPKMEDSVDDQRLQQLRGRLEQAKLEFSPSPQLPTERTRTTRSAGRSPGGGTRPATRKRSSGGSSSKMRTPVWVQPHHVDDDRWQVRREHASRASRVFDTQKEAMDFGRQLAKRDRVEFIVAGRDGAIREKHSYGNDPVRSRG